MASQPALARPDGGPALFNDGGTRPRAPSSTLPEPSRRGSPSSPETGYVVVRDGARLARVRLRPARHRPFLPGPRARRRALVPALARRSGRSWSTLGMSTYEAGAGTRPGLRRRRMRTRPSPVEAAASSSRGGRSAPGRCPSPLSAAPQAWSSSRGTSAYARGVEHRRRASGSTGDVLTRSRTRLDGAGRRRRRSTLAPATRLPSPMLRRAARRSHASRAGLSERMLGARRPIARSSSPLAARSAAGLDDRPGAIGLPSAPVSGRANSRSPRDRAPERRRPGAARHLPQPRELDRIGYETTLVAGRVGAARARWSTSREEHGVAPLYISRLSAGDLTRSRTRRGRAAARVIRTSSGRTSSTPTRRRRARSVVSPRCSPARPDRGVVHTFHGHVLRGYFGPAQRPPSGGRAPARALDRRTDRSEPRGARRPGRARHRAGGADLRDPARPRSRGANSRAAGRAQSERSALGVADDGS